MISFRSLLSTLVVATGLAMSVLGCAKAPDQPDNVKKAQEEVQQQIDTRGSPYVPKNNIEFQNYNQREQISDDLTTILWCTVFPSQPGAPIFTVPIVGKITSGNKRPYSTQRVFDFDAYMFPSEGVSPEVPGPDGMYGTSGEYRYGFTPGGVYEDFYNLETYCTTEPTVFQREQTTFVLEIDQGLATAQDQAQAALKAGDPTKANEILQSAIDTANAGK